MNIKKTIGMLGVCGMILQGVVGVSAQEKDSATANFNVESGERILRFTEESPIVNFGSIDLNGGGVKTKSAKLPEITVEDYTGTGSGYNIHLVLDKFKDSTDTELESVDVKISSEGNESNTQYGGKVYGASKDDSVMGKSSIIYKADKNNGQGKHILKEEGQTLELSVDSTELKAEETYTSTATISFNPIIVSNPHKENPTPEKVGDEWVAKIRDAYVDEKGQNATDVYVRLKEEPDGSFTIINSGINKDANNNEEILYGDLKIPSMIGNKPVNKIGENSFFKSLFTGYFQANDLIDIGPWSFFEAKFTGEFNAPKLKKIDEYGLYNSIFTGDFIAPNLTHAGYSALDNSIFTGKFDAPKIREIDDQAFMLSRFKGDFIAPNLNRVGMGAFSDSNFTGDFIAPNLTIVGHGGFYKSHFTGEVNLPKVENVGEEALKESKFTSGYVNPSANILEYNGNLADFQK